MDMPVAGILITKVSRSLVSAAQHYTVESLFNQSTLAQGQLCSFSLVYPPPSMPLVESKNSASEKGVVNTASGAGKRFHAPDLLRISLASVISAVMMIILQF